jgi:hypothetical protein
MSMSQWLKLAVIEKVEGHDEAAFRDRLMVPSAVCTAAAEGLLLAQADKESPQPSSRAHGKRLTRVPRAELPAPGRED